MTLNEFYKKDNGLSLCWFGNDGFVINSKGTLFSFDLDFYNTERILKFNFDIEYLLQNLSHFFITHEHEDHFSSKTVEAFLKKGSSVFVVPKSCEKKARALGIPNDRLKLVEPKDEFSFGDTTVHCVRAIHGHIGQSVYSGASTLDCGYIVKTNGKRLYQPGDTLLLEEHFEMGKMDVLFVSPTEHNTEVQGSLKLIEMLNPKYIFPQHHSTYAEAEDNLFWTHGYVNELCEALKDEDKKKYHVLQQGEPFEIKM